MVRRARPALLLELDRLGVVDPFRLKVDPTPDRPELVDPELIDPERRRRIPLDVAGVHVAGASQALLALSLRWMEAAGGTVAPLADAEDGCPAPVGPECSMGEVRLVLARREARLLGALLRRHLRRLAEPPPWMAELHRSLEQIDEFLRWEER